MDVLSFGETMLRFSANSGTRLEQASALQLFVAGTESNTLTCLARLGLQTTWLSALPDNPLGRRVASELRSHGVNTDSVVWADEQARLGIFYADEAPEPLGLHVYYDRANSACALLDAAAIDFSLLAQTKLLHLTGITPALSTGARALFTRFLDEAATRNVPLSFDVNYRAKLWSPMSAAAAIEDACRQATILFCTATDAAELWGFTGDAETVLRQLGHKFDTNNTQQSAKTIILTRGSKGSAQLANDCYTEEAAFQTDGPVRFGSGDAFAAGYLYAYLSESLSTTLGLDQHISALAFGNAVAALKKCIAGDIALITLADVIAVLQKQTTRRFR